MSEQQTLSDAINTIYQHAPYKKPKIGLILESDFDAVAENIEHAVTIPYQALPGVVISDAVEHTSLIMLGTLNGIEVACVKGHLHAYEGAPYAVTACLVRILKLLGCEQCIITGVARALRQDIVPGEIALIRDHINLQPGNPLTGPNDDAFGPRFVNMDDAYDPGLGSSIRRAATDLNLALHDAVYVSVQGPMLETPAEVKMFNTLGADVVGMSVVPDVIAAKHTGFKIAALCAITHYAAGIDSERLADENIVYNRSIAIKNIAKILTDSLPDIG